MMSLLERRKNGGIYGSLMPFFFRARLEISMEQKQLELAVRDVDGPTRFVYIFLINVHVHGTGLCVLQGS